LNESTENEINLKGNQGANDRLDNRSETEENFTKNLQEDEIIQASNKISSQGKRKSMGQHQDIEEQPKKRNSKSKRKNSKSSNLSKDKENIENEKKYL